MSTPPQAGRVIVVAYGDEVHVYDQADAATAETVYTTAIGANLDAERRTVSAAAWEVVRMALSEPVSIIDHRTGTPAHAGATSPVIAR